MEKKGSVSIILFLVALLLGAAVFGYYQYDKVKGLEFQDAIKENNIKALNDTVRVEKNEIGQLQYTKQSLIADKNNLSSLNKKLGDEVKNQKGEIIFLSSTVAKLRGDTNKVVVHEIEKISDSEYVISGSMENIYDTLNYRSVKFKSKIRVDSNRNVTVLNSKMEKDDFSFNVITGLKEENNNLRIFVRSDYPGLVFSKIDGALIDPRKSKTIKSFFPDKKWGLGFQTGVGLGICNQVTPCVFVGIGVSYNFLRW